MHKFCKILGNVIETLCLILILLMVSGMTISVLAWIVYTFAVWITGV